MEQQEDGTQVDSHAGYVKRANERIQSRAARIADLRRRIVDGTYHLDSAKLSAKIVDHHWRLAH
jgi:anti-sigma28 factor (negative regulator of flagellin synthesis)